MSEKAPIRAAADAPPDKILRFRRSERLIHWAFAVPFLVCSVTATVLMFFYYSDPSRPHRDMFSWIHRISGVCLFLLPPAAILRKRGDIRVHLGNIKQAWVWTIADIKWLSLMGVAAVNKRVTLPDQGKFNAAEKLNFMLLMTTYPLYLITGALIWFTDVAFLAWVAHFFMAMVATPFLLGHLFMAILNPETRVGLQGMITGYVDRKWARHHYKGWYDKKTAPVCTGDELDGSVPAASDAAAPERTAEMSRAPEPVKNKTEARATSDALEPEPVALATPGSSDSVPDDDPRSH